MNPVAPNPTILALITLDEWKIFTHRCGTHPAISEDFPSLTINVEGRSLDLYLEENGEEPENIGMLYMESYSDQTGTEIDEAIALSLIQHKAFESPQLMKGGTCVVVYYEWFDDAASFEPHEWKAIGEALQQRLTTTFRPTPPSSASEQVNPSSLN